MLLLLCSIMASLSCIAAALAVWSFVRVRKLLQGASTRSLAQLSSEVAELTSASESLLAQHRRLSARVGMREVRQRREEEREQQPPDADIGEKIIPKKQLKEIARARGYKLT